MKELAESQTVLSYRTRFEAVVSFDLEDDMEFCPNLLTECDVSCPRMPWPVRHDTQVDLD